MEVVGSVASIMTCLCTRNSLHESLAKKWEHLRRPTRKLIELEWLMVELEARKRHLHVKLERLQLEEGAEPTEIVKLWMKNFVRVKSEVTSVTNKIEERRSSGYSYFCSRIKLGECIEEKIEDIVSLLQKLQNLGDPVAEFSPNRGFMLPATPLMEYGTNVQTLMRIWQLLSDDRVKRIGVYSMGGVGKTTIMTEVNNRLLGDSRYFDNVIWVTVPKDCSIEKLQNDIAMKVGLTLSTRDNEVVRAAKLLESLTRRKRFVLILDDVWEPFSLESAGIPLPTADNGCKLVITTRLLRTCRAMETDKDVEVKVLPANEAWNLFSNKVGDEVLNSPAIQSIAKDVAKECGGLPLAIFTVGRALRNAADIKEWEYALEELKVSSTNIDCMEDSVFPRLKLSYTKLRDDTSRSCFLFCALYPEGHLIDTNELIAYWMWEGILSDVGRTLERRLKGKIILKELRQACLLENATQVGEDSVKMHDVIRDMAITIMNQNPYSIVNAGANLTKPPGLYEWGEHVQRVSLMRNDLKYINFSPRCPRLTTLLLQYNSFVEGCSGIIWVSNAVKAIKGGATIEELISSSKLSVLDVNFWNLEVYNEYAKSGHWRQLAKYKFIVGSDSELSTEEKSLILCTGSGSALIPICTKELKLSGSGSVKRLSTQLLNVTDLKKCEVIGDGNMECILESEENNFPNLEIMRLLYMYNLRMICGRVVRPRTLRSLKSITVVGWDRLKSLFSSKLLPELQNLETINIHDTFFMEEMIEDGIDDKEGNSHASIVCLPNLKWLNLYSMPCLKSIYNGVLMCISLRSIVVVSCNSLKRLPFGLLGVGANENLSSPPALEVIRGTESWWESLEWDQLDAKYILQPYFVKSDNDMPSDRHGFRPFIMQPSSSNEPSSSTVM